MFSKWDCLSYDNHNRQTCLWHDDGFMLVRVPITSDCPVQEWILLRKIPYAVIGILVCASMRNPYVPPIKWADRTIESLREECEV